MMWRWPAAFFPVDAYVEHGSAALKQSFCELLAFATPDVL